MHLRISLFRIVPFALGVWLSLLPASSRLIAQQDFVANYEESRVPAYELPPIIEPTDAHASDFSAQWSQRRSELLQIFAKQVYGTAPQSPYELKCERFETGSSLNGKALRQQWRVTLSTASGELTIELLIYTPANAGQQVPCFLGLNFGGNHTVTGDPQVPVTSSWVRERGTAGTQEHRATEAGRGSAESRWPVEQIVDAGVGVATAYYGDIDPDFDDNFENGVHALFPEHQPAADQPQRWGSIAGWAWGLSRLLDCLQQVPEVDGDRVAVIGHSRLGKTALWAGASDARFVAVISNNSGCGGAALSRRAFGETVGRINTSFPHWFCPNFHQYNQNESHLPVDQHQLLALIAPRLVYVASATEDEWADPTGEFIALNQAAALYRRLPEAQGDIRRVGYHLRHGKHALTAWDWAHYIRFLDQL